MNKRIAKLAGTLAFLLLTTPAGATTWLVPAELPTIAAGLAAAAPGDTVLVSAGIYLEHGLVMSDGVVLRGETGHHADVVIDAQQLGRVLFCDGLGPATAVEDLTITGGLAEGDGSDAYGGGVFCEHSALRFSGCAIVGNHAVVGGGINLRYDADVLFEDCLFRENTGVSSGGALRVYQSAPILRRCQFIGNLVEMDGAGIFSGASGMLIEDSLFQGNEAGIWGGALVLMSPNEGNLVVRGCTFVDNTALWSGSALFSGNQCPFRLENCLVVGNRESEALYINDLPAFEAITCCEVYDNPDGDFGGTLTDQIGLNGNISLPPVFCDSAAGDFSLAANSPCLPENNECGVLMGAFGMGCGVTEAPTLASFGPALSAQPNPFNPATKISYTIPVNDFVSLVVYSVDGRVVKTLVSEQQPSGGYEVDWNGKDDNGRPVASGTYLYRLEAGRYTQLRKMTLAK